MKAVTLILISVLCLKANGYLIKVPTSETNIRVGKFILATEGWVHIQRLLLPLFENVCEESKEPTIVRLNKEFKLDPSNGVYLKADVIDNLQNHKANKGLLAKGEIFTESNQDHLNELKVVYELLYYAKDFDTFYKAACWARQNVNCGLFVDALYLAILNRRDTEQVSIPTPIEVLPNYFIRKDFVIKASSLIRGESIPVADFIRNEGNSYILDVNYTISFYDGGDDKLAYFHEDVGLNSYYFLTKLNNLPWVSISPKNNDGQYLYHTMKQLMTRYNLERYSNGLPELDNIDWNYINEAPYDPLLIYSNGNEFGQRIEANVGNSEILTLLKKFENNLPAVVEHMRAGGYNKSDILNHLMEIVVTNERSYLNLALQLLSEYEIPRSPSVLEHYLTSVRDPIFWKLNKKIVELIDNSLQVLPSYSRNELYLPGVQIQNIEVKKMMTSFENFEFDVTNALSIEGEESKFDVKISQSRLNHKPFSIKISVSSLVAQKGLVKVYIGPKLMPGELVEKRNLFMLLDCFEVNLKIGSNIITKTSSDMKNLSDDLLSLKTLRKYVLDAEFGVNSLPLKSIWSQIGFPSRLILPKGTSEGLPLHVFVFIAPYFKSAIEGFRTNSEINSEAIFSPGYPLDLNIEIQQLFNLPNAMVKDVSIVHKSETTYSNKPVGNYNTVSNSNIWQSSDDENDISHGLLSLSTRPEFTKKSFDYKSKKNQYDKKFDYSEKRDNYKYRGKQDEEIKVHENETHQNSDEDSGNSLDIKNQDIIDTPESKDVVNNIYINPDFVKDSLPIFDDNEKSHNLFIVDKDNISDISLINLDTSQTNDFEKVIDIKNPIVKSHGLLSSPRKKYSSVFNIVFKPLKVNSDEKVYE